MPWPTLELAFAAGVAGAKLSILVLLTPSFNIPISLRKQARENLQQLPYPGDQQIQELLLDPDIHPFPDLHLLKPLFQIYPDEGRLRQLFVDQAILNLGVILLSSAIKIDFETGKKARQERLRTYRRSMQNLSQSLAELQEYPRLRLSSTSRPAFPTAISLPKATNN